MEQIIECVPNFSEGRDLDIIKQITDEIESVEGVKLLDVDPGASTNRTVVTLVGSPDAVVEAAFLGIKKASELIDMRQHKGTHPRMGATDVCPLIPVSGISAEDTIPYAHQLAEKVGNELQIPIYLYEQAAQEPKRQNLATIRAGEYEGFREKILLDEWKPDYGPQQYNEQAGQTVIGVRDFLVAYNINLNTKSVRRANSVAFDIREKGRKKREGGVITGKLMKDENGKAVWEPGACKSVKAIGWYVDEYGIAQVSANLTNINITPVHVAFEEARKAANQRGLRVTGSELVGLIPKKSLLEAGKYYLGLQGLSQGVSEDELVEIAVKSLGLDELGEFDVRKKVIEYQLEDALGEKLSDLTVKGFADLLASDEPAPGGGSVAALLGSLGAALGAMVANLSAKKYRDRVPEFSEWAVKGQELKARLMHLINEDTNAFNKVMAANRLPKKSADEKAIRQQKIDEANRYATLVPYQTMETAFESYELLEAMAKDGNPNSVSDAGVGALCVHACIEGAGMNVKINLGDIEDAAFHEEMLGKVADLRAKSAKISQRIVQLVETKL